MKINFTETVLRDANQSLIATRLAREDFEEVLSSVDKAGYYSVECWGGATFDVCMRYLNEDPWERLKIMRQAMPNTKLQMLLRGQYLLGYKCYSDDVVRKFVFNCVEKGIDIIRIFDALNTIGNIEVAVNETLRCGAHPSCAISYTTSPVHNTEYYIRLAKDMESLGAKTLCIKDMAGILIPDVAYELISELKKTIGIPIILHSHCSTGLAYMTYLKAIEAGVDVIDTAISSFSGGTSQPATETMAIAAKGMGYEVDLDMNQLKIIDDHFKGVCDKYIKKGIFNPAVMMTNPSTLVSQIPGGMYSNLISQLGERKIIDHLDEVVEEIPRVRKDLGYPPLVTPISQIVGTQAATNVLIGERYKVVSEEIKAYLRGEYGIPLGQVDKELMKKLVGREEFPKERYSKNLPYIYDELKKKPENKRYGRSDILEKILFPKVAEEFLKKRDSRQNMRFHYSFHKISDSAAKKLKLRKARIEENIEALLKAILVHKLDCSAQDISIKGIYNIEEEGGV
ncbi:MAG: Conserved carboxylase region [Anaerocolumna sp.]|jgi:oxaloacetate decarboxylase alpha subunit|nr:Conserved carboxylase region [Anaerocolumna sp.]